MELHEIIKKVNMNKMSEVFKYLEQYKIDYLESEEIDMNQLKKRIRFSTYSSNIIYKEIKHLREEDLIRPTF